MWLRTVILVNAAFCFLAEGAEIFDVTTIYEIGNAGSCVPESFDFVADDFPEPPPDPPCRIRDVSGRIHSRTNALGMGLIDNGYNYINPENLELPNITCDLNYFLQRSCSNWEPRFTDKLKLVQNPAGNITMNGAAYPVMQNMTLGLRNIQPESYIYFTRGSKELKNDYIDLVIKFYHRHYAGPHLYHNCQYSSSDIPCPYKFTNVRDRDQSTATICCHSDYKYFVFDYDSDFLTFSFSDKRIKIYRGEQRTLVVDRTDEGIAANSNYFSLSTADVMDISSTAFTVKVFETDELQAKMISPVFTPKTNNLCLAMMFSSSMETLHSVLSIEYEHLFPNSRHRLHTIRNVKEGWNTKIINVTLNNLDPIKLIITNLGVAKIDFARISSCSPSGEEVFEFSLPFSKYSTSITSSRFGPEPPLPVYTAVPEKIYLVEEIEDSNNECWNDGVMTSAGCACTPGFTGSRCEIGCGRNRFGQDCEGFCSSRSQECEGLLLCNKYTKCHCAPGYTGRDCKEKCSPGWYGNDCSQRCGHCEANSACNIYSGVCSACEQGYLAPYCKQVSVYYGSKPTAVSPSYGTIVVSFDSSNYITVQEPPQLYQIQFREKGEDWRVFTSKTLQKVSDDSENDKKISETIEGLKTGIFYEVRVLLIDANFMKYDGPIVQMAVVLTKCDIPENVDYKVKVSSNTTSLAFSWNYINENPNRCPLETFEVSWKEGWKWLTNHTNDNYILSGLFPGTTIPFKVRAKTSGGFAPYSKTIFASALQKGLQEVRNLRVVSSQSTSAEISWETPRGTDGKQLRYTISYKCVNQPACSPGCQNVSEGQLTQEDTSITLSPLQPFTQYLVTVTAEDGLESSIYVGTTKVVPTEIPSLSAQKPVRTNTSLTVFWDQGPVCSGYLLGYNYQLLKTSDSLKVLASGFTKDTNISFHYLTASTDYVVKVFVSTVAGWNPQSYLAINTSTSATVPEAVRNLTVYKRGRGMLGLRWAEPRASYGQLKSFTVSHTLGQEVTSHTVEPTHCVVWPDLYCHTIEGLRSNRRYNVSVSARNMEVAEDGEPAFSTGITKESSPSAPVNLGLKNSTSTSVVLEWSHPNLPNGIVRSFLVSVEETEKYDQESCCQIYPLIETSVKDESQTYEAEVSGLHPASTYYVSVSAKTVGLGPSQSLVVYTRPPLLPFTVLPTVEVATVEEMSWLPQEQLPEVNNSHVYTSLVKAHLLLAVLNETQAVLEMQESGITDPKLNSLLQQTIGKPFYFISEYNQEDIVEISESLEQTDSEWGQAPATLPPNFKYQLVAAQVMEYNGVYNVGLRFSQPLLISFSLLMRQLC